MIDHTVVGVETEGDGWRIIMRDVSDTLIPPKIYISPTDSRRILRAVAALHTAFYGTTVAGLCTLTDRYRLLSPAVAEVELSDPSSIPRLVRRGWEIFPELVPADVSDAVFTTLAAPHLLADELQRHDTTLIHGDLHLANVGLGADWVILLDWGLLTAIAPPAVEFAYYLVMRSHHAQIDALPEELIEDFHASAPERFDVGALQLSLRGHW